MKNIYTTTNTFRTTTEKMFFIKKLMDEVEFEVRKTAKNIEDIDRPLYRMLTHCADAFKNMSENFHSPTSGYKIDSWDKQLNDAYIISKNLGQ